MRSLQVLYIGHLWNSNLSASLEIVFLKGCLSICPWRYAELAAISVQRFVDVGIVILEILILTSERRQVSISAVAVHTC